MKQSALTPKNAYFEFRFEDSLRRYERPPFKKIKTSVQSCHHCVKKTHQISKAERLSRIASSRKQYGGSNQRANRSSQNVSPIKNNFVSDFGLASQCVPNSLNQLFRVNSIQPPQIIPETPIKKLSVLGMNQSMKQDPSPSLSNQPGNSIRHCFGGIFDQSSKIQRNESLSVRLNFKEIEEIARKEDLLIEEESSQIIGVMKLKTKEKGNLLERLDSISQSNGSPFAQYLFELFDSEKYCEDESPGKAKENAPEETPFSKVEIHAFLEPSQRKEEMISMDVQLEKLSHSKCSGEGMKNAIPQPKNLQFYRKGIEQPQNSLKRKRKPTLGYLSESSFPGGSLRINNGTKQFLLSIRVFNQFIRPYSNVDDIVKALIQQRPYLGEVAEKLKQIVKEHLNSY